MAAAAIWASLIAVAAPPAPGPLAGYYDGGQMEIAAGLELGADGRFRYGLSYGALDEAAEGEWRAEAVGVRLVPRRFDTNDPSGGVFPPVLLPQEGDALLLDRHGRRLRFVRP